MNQIANMLRAYGVKKGDRVALYMPVNRDKIIKYISSFKMFFFLRHHQLLLQQC